MRGATSKKPGKRTEQSAPRPEYGRGTGVPNPIDVEVGGRIRTRRLLVFQHQTGTPPGKRGNLLKLNADMPDSGVSIGADRDPSDSLEF